MARMLRSLVKISLDEVLQSATQRALMRAARAAADVEDGEAADSPMTLRPTKRVVAFYEGLATELGISRHAAIHLVLEQMINTVEAT